MLLQEKASWMPGHVWHKQDSTPTDDGYRLEIWDLKCSVILAEAKGLICFSIIAQLICTFVLTYEPLHKKTNKILR